ncbi:MAG: hypothetical protein A2158_00275 [Chloroflexi bacterium RBG_13_46_14]|nr:MAG: hypothetical protein A2158_00275 [Chloroflexi bacterium RBG_13_46_14]
MAINIGNTIIYVDEERNGECVKGKIVDIWKNNSGEITDYFVALDSGRYTNVKPHFPDWCKVDDHFLCFDNNRLSLSFLSPGYAFAANV